MARTEAKKLKGDKRYTDAPRYQAIYGYEDDFKSKFKKSTEQMSKEIILTANKMVREN